MAWYREWFKESYLDLYAHRDAGEAESHIEFVEKVLTGSRPRTVLDLACGAGRHTEVLRRREHRALGLDLSLTLLSQSSGLPRVAGDMCRLPFAGDTFDWVLNFFTSFGYFEKERQNFLVLQEIRRVLSIRGRFLIDLFNRERVIETLVPRESQKIAGTEAEIERWFDSGTERVNKRIRLTDEHGRVSTFLESVRAYREEEVTIGLRWAGLEVDDIYGDFAGKAFSRDSERLIIVGHRPD